MIGLTRRQADFPEIMNPLFRMFLSPTCKGNFSFIWLLSFTHPALLNNLFGNIPYVERPLLYPPKPDTAFRSTAKSSSANFPNSPAKRDTSIPLAPIQPTPGIYRPRAQPSPQQVATKGGGNGNVGGRLGTSHSFLPGWDSRSSQPAAFPSLSCSRHLCNQTRSKAGEADKPPPRIAYPAPAGA